MEADSKEKCIKLSSLRQGIQGIMQVMVLFIGMHLSIPIPLFIIGWLEEWGMAKKEGLV